MGLALSLYDKITAQVGGGDVRVSVLGEGEDDLATDHRHLIASTMLRTFDLLGIRPNGFTLKCENAIPQARGMGSSSAAIVAGLLLARQLFQGGTTQLSEHDVIRLAAEFEGHPDQVASCVLGGFTIAWNKGSNSDGARAVRLEDAKGLVPVIFLPRQRGHTVQARAMLPTNVSLPDAVFNVARAALLVRAVTGRPDLLFDATEDRLHQDYRASAMPDTAKLVAVLREDGIAAVVSGSGPSVLALVGDDDQHLVTQAQRHCPEGWRATPLSIADGARVWTDNARGVCTPQALNGWNGAQDTVEFVSRPPCDRSRIGYAQFMLG
jgi:homoserine kinase